MLQLISFKVGNFVQALYSSFSEYYLLEKGVPLARFHEAKSLIGSPYNIFVFFSFMLKLPIRN